MTTMAAKEADAKDRKLFVGNLSYNSTQATLEEYFGQFGPIHEVGSAFLSRAAGKRGAPHPRTLPCAITSIAILAISPSTRMHTCSHANTHNSESRLCCVAERAQLMQARSLRHQTGKFNLTPP